MIYCVEFRLVEQHLRALGYELIGASDENRYFGRAGRLVVLHAPNVNGHIPEMLMHRAFDAAHLRPPDLPSFWCD